MLVLTYFLCLIVYSVIGWAYESALCSIKEGELINRGFLNGPVCPVYGFGALASIVFLYQRTDSLLLLFLAGMLLSCTVEYITAVLLEKIFNTKWWDYSNYRFNLHGRISLLGAVVFGILSVLLVKYIHPVVSGFILGLPFRVLLASSLAAFIILMTDLYFTVRHLLLLNGRLQEIQYAINCFVGQYAKRAGTLKDSLLDKFEESDFYSDRIKILFSLSRFQNIRLARAFPRLKSVKYNDAWQKLKATLLGTDDE